MTQTHKERIAEILREAGASWGFSEGNKIIVNRAVLEFHPDDSFCRAYGDINEEDDEW
jgi:hypothetical protein